MFALNVHEGVSESKKKTGKFNLKPKEFRII